MASPEQVALFKQVQVEVEAAGRAEDVPVAWAVKGSQVEIKVTYASPAAAAAEAAQPTTEVLLPAQPVKVKVKVE